MVMPSDERKGTRFKKERNQKRGQSQARKRHRTHNIYICIKEEKEGTRGGTGGRAGTRGATKMAHAR